MHSEYIHDSSSNVPLKNHRTTIDKSNVNVNVNVSVPFVASFTRAHYVETDQPGKQCENICTRRVCQHFHEQIEAIVRINSKIEFDVTI